MVNQGGPTQDGANDLLSKGSVSIKIDDVHKLIVEKVTEQIDKYYDSKIKALEINIKTYNQLIDWIKIVGGLLAIGVAVVGWWFGNSYSEATKFAYQAATSAFEREFFKKRENVKDFAELKAKYEEAINGIIMTEKQLQGYVQLRDIVGNIENFDPLELYAQLDKEIDERYNNSRLLSMEGNSGVDIKSTTYDPAFRQKASFVFNRLLGVVKNDVATGNPKVDVVTLFNASANASKMDMDFVSLEFMEAAVAQDKSKSPENYAKLIRQRLAMSRISSEEAIRELKETLSRSNSFHLHLVLAEAFNIGVRTAKPVMVAGLVLSNLPDRLRASSFAILIAAHLYMMGETPEEWKQGLKLFQEGKKILEDEPKFVRWKEYSIQERDRIASLANQ